MYVCHNEKFGFVHIRKTGGQAIKSYLLNNFNTMRVGDKHGGVDQVPDIEDYFLFAFVRDPYKRFSSLYRFMIIRDIERGRGPFWLKYPTPFSFAKDCEWLSQSKLINERFKIYKYEDYKNNVRMLAKRFNMNVNKLPINPGTHYYGSYDWRNWIDNESILFINEHCKEDFEPGYDMLSGIPSGPDH